MKGIAELVLGLFELAEAEGRLLRENVERTGKGCLVAALGIIFIGFALAFIITAIYFTLKIYMPAPVAFLIIAGCCLLIGVILIWIAKPRNHKIIKDEKSS